MDIRKILKENAFGAPIAYQHLDPLHVGVLRKVASGNFDPDIASPKVQAVLDDLVGLGLVNDITFDLTQTGAKALQYVEKLGGSIDRRQAVMNKEKAQLPAKNPIDDEFLS